MVHKSLLVVILLAAFFTSPTAGSGGPDLIHVAYSGSAAATGNITLECTSTFASIQRSGSAMRVLAAGGARVESATERYMTVPLPPSGQPYQASPWLAGGRSSDALASGPLEVTLRPGGGLWVFAAPQPGAASDLALRLQANQLDWSPVAGSLRTVEYHEQRNSEAGVATVIGRHPATTGPVRIVQGTGLAELRGEMSILLRDATIRLPDGTDWSLPDHVQHEDAAASGAKREIRTDGWLHLSQATLMAEQAPVSAHCQDMRQAVLGEVTWSQATARLGMDGASQFVMLDGLVTLKGDTSLRDTPLTGSAEVEGEGKLSWAAEDLTVVHASLFAPPVALALLATFLLLARRALPALYFLYTRLKESELLDHPVRRLIMDHVEANPGTNLHAMALVLRMPRSSIRHHLRILVAGGVVVQHNVGGERLLVPDRGHATLGAKEAILEAKEPARWLARATEGGPVPRRRLAAEMSAAFGMSDSGARKWIARCETLGVLRAEGRGHGMVYHCAI